MVSSKTRKNVVGGARRGRSSRPSRPQQQSRRPQQQSRQPRAPPPRRTVRQRISGALGATGRGIRRGATALGRGATRVGRSAGRKIGNVGRGVGRRVTGALSSPFRSANSKMRTRHGQESADLNRRHGRETSDMNRRHQNELSRARTPEERAAINRKHAQERSALNNKHGQERRSLTGRQNQERSVSGRQGQGQGQGQGVLGALGATAGIATPLMQGGPGAYGNNGGPGGYGNGGPDGYGNGGPDGYGNGGPDGYGNGGPDGYGNGGPGNNGPNGYGNNSELNMNGNGIPDSEENSNNDGIPDSEDPNSPTYRGRSGLMSNAMRISSVSPNLIEGEVVPGIPINITPKQYNGPEDPDTYKIPFVKNAKTGFLETMFMTRSPEGYKYYKIYGTDVPTLESNIKKFISFSKSRNSPEGKFVSTLDDTIRNLKTEIEEQKVKYDQLEKQFDYLEPEKKQIGVQTLALVQNRTNGLIEQLDDALRIKELSKVE